LRIIALCCLVITEAFPRYTEDCHKQNNNNNKTARIIRKTSERHYRNQTIFLRVETEHTTPRTSETSSERVGRERTLMIIKLGVLCVGTVEYGLYGGKPGGTERKLRRWRRSVRACTPYVHTGTHDSDGDVRIVSEPVRFPFRAFTRAPKTMFECIILHIMTRACS